jgi:RNA polymerase sigma-70 factor, ECF subfamily
VTLTARWGDVVPQACHNADRAVALVTGGRPTLLVVGERTRRGAPASLDPGSDPAETPIPLTGTQESAEGTPGVNGTAGATNGVARQADKISKVDMIEVDTIEVDMIEVDKIDKANGRRVDGMTVIVGTPPAATHGPVTLTAPSRDAVARELWDLHYAPLAGWCAALVGDRDAAHDIASEAFTRLLAKWVTVRDARGFLYVTATNLARDRWRREQRDRRLYARLELVTPSSAPASDPWLRDLVERLPDRMRMPVLLHYYADMSIAEVATALHRPQGTIKRTLSDARTRLHGWLENDE